MTIENQVKLFQKSCKDTELLKIQDALMERISKDGRWAGELSNYHYHKLPGISSSQVNRLFSEGKYAMFFDLIYGGEDKRAAMTFGEEIHEIFLSGKEFISDEEIYDEILESGKVSPRATKAYKQWVGEQEDKGFSIVSKEKKLMIERWTYQIKKQSLLKDIFYDENKKVETSVFCICKNTGLLLKCRPDILDIKNNIMFDLKTSIDIQHWSKVVETYGYNIQAYFYIYVLNTFFKENRFSMFPFVILSKKRPYYVVIKSCGKEHLELANSAVNNILPTIARAFETKNYGEYNINEIEQSIPNLWYLKTHEEKIKTMQDELKQ